MNPSPSPSLEALGIEALAHHRAGRLDEARAIYERIIELDPSQPSALDLLGMIHHQQGRQEQAADFVQRAIAAAPTVAGFYHHLGVIRMKQRQCADAEKSFRRAMELGMAGHVESLNNLGLALQGQGRVDEAIEQFQRTIELHPTHPAARNNLGNAWRVKKMNDQAIAAYRQAVALQNDYYRAWVSLGTVLFEVGDLAGAEEACRRAIALRPDLLDPRLTLAGALEHTGRKAEAINQVREADRLMASGSVRGTMPASELKFRLAALSGEPEELGKFPVAPPDYVSHLYDTFAHVFDEHLVQKLHYRAPQLLYDAVAKAGINQRGPLDIVDLGCGTGLCAPLFAPLARSLIGVDLSSRMIEGARARGLYQELFTAELLGFLQERDNEFDLAIGGDVFEYFGDLSGVFECAARALRPGGVLAFTTEALSSSTRGEAGYTLLPTMRYAHSSAYVRSLLPAAGLRELSIGEGVLRIEQEKDVNGLIVLLEKPADA